MARDLLTTRRIYTFVHAKDTKSARKEIWTIRTEGLYISQRHFTKMKRTLY